MTKVRFETIWARCLDFQPDFQTFDMENMVTFSWESFDSFVRLEILQANIASFEPHVFVLFQENDGLDFSKVLVMVSINLLQRLRQSLSILLHNALLIQYIVNNSSLHQEYAIFMQGSHKFLPSVNFLLDV